MTPSPMIQGPYKVKVEWAVDATEEDKQAAVPFIRDLLDTVNTQDLIPKAVTEITIKLI